MDSIWISIIIPIASTVLAFAAAILTIIFNFRLEKLKDNSAKDIEFLKTELIKIEKSEILKQKYSNPLLEVAEELHNKLNDVVHNHGRVLKYFKNLSKTLKEIKSIGEILDSPTKIYISSILYLFARYFAIVEIIKKEFGYLRLASNRETKSLHIGIKRTVAVLFSNRLHENISIREPNQIKYQGKILEGAQTLMGESMLIGKEHLTECISFREFCNRIATDKEFLHCFSPVIDFFENLELVPNVDSDDIDFRWAKILFLALFLRELIEIVDTEKIVTLLSEIKEETIKYIKQNPILEKNLESFRNARR